MRFLIGIDDTDNEESRGTGHHGRQLGKLLAEGGLAQLEGITRHQLLQDPRIPYTAKNSAVCLAVRLEESRQSEAAEFCRQYLLRESAPGADAGLCVAHWEAVNEAIQEFGLAAKREVLTSAEAVRLAEEAGILLEGLTGDKIGLIGALAGVGLRAGGSEGRFVWLPGLRQLEGVYTVEQLQQAAQIKVVIKLDHTELPLSARVSVGEWVRPILHNGQAALLVEDANDTEESEWRTAAKEIVKRY